MGRCRGRGKDTDRVRASKVRQKGLQFESNRMVLWIPFLGLFGTIHDIADTTRSFYSFRLMALELHRRYGGEALERRSKEEEAHLSLLERALKIRLNEADAINYERKMEQMKVGAKATSLEEEIRATDAKIRMLQRKCEALRESAEKRV